MIMPARRPTYISTMTATKIAATRLKTDDDDDHREHGGDRERIVLEQTELSLLRHLAATGAGIEDVGRRGRPAAGADLEQAVDHALAKVGPCRG
jgi:hypothetical protein